MLIVHAYRKLMETITSFAACFHISDTHVHEVFNRYVKMNRLPFTNTVYIDEVFLDMGTYCKYALLIQNFYTDDPIDLLRSRQADVTDITLFPFPRKNAME